MSRPIPVPIEDMNHWMVELRHVGAHVRKALGILLRRDLLDEDLSHHLMTASERAGQVQNALIRAGAEDPRQAERAARPPAGPERSGEHSSSTLSEGVPLSLLSSPAAVRYAEAIRAAADACRQMEMERGIDPEDGVTCGLVSLAESVEFACYGPKELRGRDG